MTRASPTRSSLIRSSSRSARRSSSTAAGLDPGLDLHAEGHHPGSIITIKTNDGQFVNYPASDSRQALNADSLQLLAAVRGDTVGTDKVGDFVNIHPDWVAQS